MMHPKVAAALSKIPAIHKIMGQGKTAAYYDSDFAANVMATEMDKIIRVNFLEGFLGLHPNSLVSRAGQVLGRISTSLKEDAGYANPHVGPLLEYGESPEGLLEFFSPGRTKLYNGVLPAVRKNAPPSMRVDAPDVFAALISGLNPLTGDAYARTRGKPLFWHIGHSYRSNPYQKGPLLGKVGSYAFRTVANFMKDLGRSERALPHTSLDAPIGGEDSAATLGKTLEDVPQDFDFDAVMSNPSVQRALDAAMLDRINSRAQSAHGNSEAERRRDLELAIWQTVKSNPELIDVDDAFNFSAKQSELGARVNALTGYDAAPAYIARLFREKIGNDLRVTLSSGPVAMMIDKMTDISRTYQSERRRKMARRIVAAYLLRKG